MAEETSQATAAVAPTELSEVKPGFTCAKGRDGRGGRSERHPGADVHQGLHLIGLSFV